MIPKIKKTADALHEAYKELKEADFEANVNTQLTCYYEVGKYGVLDRKTKVLTHEPVDWPGPLGDLLDAFNKAVCEFKSEASKYCDDPNKFVTEVCLRGSRALLHKRNFHSPIDEAQKIQKEILKLQNKLSEVLSRSTV